MLNPNDADLTSRFLKGEQAAFSVLFNRYYPDLILFAFTYLKDKASSEEVVQDVFIRLWENRESLIITTSIRSFLLKSVQNKCLDLIRHNRIRERYRHDHMMQSSILMENDTEHYILYSELSDKLERTLKELPEDLGRVFRMNRFEARTYPEIAEAIHVSVRTVEVRMGKALALLREKLKDYLTVVTTTLLFLCQ